MKIPGFVYFRKDAVPTYNLRRPADAKTYLREEMHFETKSKGLPSMLNIYPPHWAPYNAIQYSFLESKFKSKKAKAIAKSNVSDLKNIDVSDMSGVKDKEEAKRIGVYLGHFNDLVEEAGKGVKEVSDEIQEPINRKRRLIKKLSSSDNLNLAISLSSGGGTLGLGIISGVTDLKLQTGVDYSSLGVATLGLSSIGVALKAPTAFSWVAEKVISYQIDRLENKRRVEENKIFEGLLEDVSGTFKECLPQYVKKPKEVKGIEILVIPPEIEPQIQT